jgi:transcription elongation factor Elf1
MPENILSCPHCPSTEVVIARTNPNACWVECANCGATAKSAPTRAEAIANWNRTVERVQAVVADDGDTDYWKTVVRIYSDEYDDLPRCPHGNRVADWSGAVLQPPCGCSIESVFAQALA